jgi:hypothetical protein
MVIVRGWVVRFFDRFGKFGLGHPTLDKFISGGES